MKLFRKNKADVNPKREELAGRIAGRIIGTQSRLAAYLNSRTRHLTCRRKLLLLIVFCLLFAAANLWLLIGSITH
ncbi:hypothetical protein [Sphingobacterium kyonggiense]|uniref:hypothetical protein n=1 Tax=Sphingobacterium kyonggiense TaxID=714075 RepID=UPI0031D96247